MKTKMLEPRPLEFHAAVVRPIVDSSMRGLCTRPYPRRPNGCPHYGRRDRCPPAAPLFKNAFDTGYAIWALWADFDLGHHRERQRLSHPTWSLRQLVNCQHWQGTVRAFLHRKAKAWVEQHWSKPRTSGRRDFFYTDCPEAMGVNVTATMQNVGVELEWSPKDVTRMIFLAGVRK